MHDYETESALSEAVGFTMLHVLSDMVDVLGE